MFATNSAAPLRACHLHSRRPAARARAVLANSAGASGEESSPSADAAAAAAAAAAVAASAPSWLRELLPRDADVAAALRRDPALSTTNPAAAAQKLASLRALMPGQNLTKVILLAPALLRQPEAETRALFAQLQVQFASQNVAQIICNRPSLLLKSTSAGQLREWAKRKVAAPVKRKPAPAAAPAPGEAEADVAPSSNFQDEARAAARRAVAEIVAAGRAAPRGFGSPPPLPPAALDEENERDEIEEDGDGDGDDGEEEEEEEESQEAVQEFESALEAATKRAEAARSKLDSSYALVAQIEARWEARRKRSLGGPKRPKGAMSDRRKARAEVEAPWLAAPWARRDERDRRSEADRLLPPPS